MAWCARRGSLPARLALMVGVLLLQAGCEQVEVTTVGVSRVDVSPNSATVAPQEAVRLSAAVLGDGGQPLSGRTVEWSSLDPGVATVGNDGTVTGLAPGVVTIRASSEGVAGTATVTVTAGPAIHLTPADVEFVALQNGSTPGDRTLSIANSGGGTLGALTAEVRPGNAPAGWLNATLSGTTAPTSLALSVNQAGLAPGTYTAFVDIASPAAGNSPVSASVTLRVTEPPPAIALGTTAASFAAAEAGAVPAAQSIGVTNAGGSALAGLAVAVEYTAGQPAGWLSATLAGTVAPTTLVLRPTTTSITAGTYTAAVRVLSETAQNSPQTVSVTYTLGAAQPNIGLDPAQLSFEARAGGGDPAARTVAISNAGGGGSLSGLSISVSYPGGQPAGWLTTSLSSTTAPATLTVGAVTGSLAEGTYTATIQVGSGAAANSPQLVQVTFAVGAPGPRIAISPGQANFSATLAGNDPAPIQISVSNAGGGTIDGLAAAISYPEGQPTGWLTAQLSAASAPATLTLAAARAGLGAGSFAATVRLTAADGVTPVDVPVTFTVAEGAPLAPTALRATAISDRRIDLTWTDNSTNEAGFNIERSNDGGANWTLVATTEPNQRAFLDAFGLAGSTQYVYRVSACNAAGCTPAAATASATTAPEAPSPLTAVVVSSTQIRVTWSDNSPDETGFVLERTTDGGQTWGRILAAAPNTTSFVDNVSAGVTYRYRAQACRGELCSRFSNQAEATPTPTPPPPPPPVPAPPSGLSATATSASRIDLSWSAPGGTVTEYRLQRKTGQGGTYAGIATVSGSTLGHADTGLSAATQYVYRVQACNASGCSDFSGEASATTQSTAPPPPPPPPSVPGGLSATAASTSRIDLSWSASTGTVSEYRLQRKTGPGGTFATVQTLGGTTLGYADTGLSPATQYVYRVQACNAGGCSAFSAEASATTQTPAPTAPSAPTGLSATAASTSRIDVSWSAASGTVTEYRLQRKTGAGGSYAPVATLGGSTLGYADTGLTAGTQYVYRVQACNAGACSDFSNEASATTQQPPPVAPTAPTGLSATAASTSRIDVSWSAASGTVTEYRLQRKTGAGGSYAPLATLGGSTLNYADTGLTPGTQYFYRVQACNAGACSDFSGEASATTQSLLAPAAPSGFSATAASTSRIDLAWSHDGLLLVDRFEIQRAPQTNPSAFAALATTGPGARTYADTDLPAGTGYVYRVRACSIVGCSAWAQASATTLVPVGTPNVPTGVSVSATSPTQATLRWTAPGGQTHYEIRRRTGTGGQWTDSFEAGANATSFTNSGLSPGETYQYQVRACAASCSDFSAPVTVTLPEGNDGGALYMRERAGRLR